MDGVKRCITDARRRREKRVNTEWSARREKECGEDEKRNVWHEEEGEDRMK